MRLLGFVLTVAFVYQAKSRTMDEALSSAIENSQAFDLVSSESSGIVRVELDILMFMDDYLKEGKAREEEQKGKRKKRKAYRLESSRWPNNLVPYTIESGTFSSSDINVINNAINTWNTQTCLRFQTRSSENDYVVFQNGNGGCSSFVGRIGGSQGINLANGCRFRDIVEHEIGHAIGFWHEQSRPDRDGYVTVVEGNVISSLLYNFEKKPVSQVNTFQVAYDYRSVMHYGQNAFSVNGQPTIRTIDPAFQTVIGTAPTLSFRDIKLANLMYNCAANCPSLLCPGEGFVGKDCSCKCPTGNPNSPIQNCASIPQSTTTTQSTTSGAVVASTTAAPPVAGSTTTPAVVPTTTQPACQNRHRLCGLWSRFGFCSRSRFIRMYCKVSCNTCTAVERCEDFGMHCSYLMRRGFCNSRNRRISSYMRSSCAATCEFCEAGQLLGVNAQSNAPGLGFTSLIFLVPMVVLSQLLHL